MTRGTIRGTRQGFAFLAREEGGEDIFIAQRNLAGAIDGDRVEISVSRPDPFDFRSEGTVEKILERPHPLFTGNVVRIARTIFVIPDSPVLPSRIRLKVGRQAAPHGSKVVFRVGEPSGGRSLTATLERILGDADDPSLDRVVVATSFHLSTRFPDEVLDEAMEAASSEESESVERVDYSDRLVLTIDPKTAKDFDDAISLQKDRTGFHLQVHIADVSSYVVEGGPLDLEAARRGTSVYFPGSAIPMLPEILSTRTASLVPGEERRVLTVEIDLDPKGSVRETRLREGTIRSAARLHYEQAHRMLTETDGDREVRESLREMNELAGILRRRRYLIGGFDLELPEADMVLDGRGVPKRIWRHRTLDSNRLIEEFMILANRSVGQAVVDEGWPLLFRVHGEPDTNALERFAEIVLTLLPGTRARDIETIPALRRFLATMPEEPMTRIVHSFFLRSMKKAVYSPIDLGHFGLGIDRYCHFTSPIRRYPDLFNHRVVRSLIRRNRDLAEPVEPRQRLQDVAIRCARDSSKAEQVAEKAEREMNRLKTLRWAAERLGETFAGRVVGVIPAGMFVELDKVPVEGFLPSQGLKPGVRYIEERFAFVDRRSRFELRLGDAVSVVIARVDLRERRLDFELTSTRTARHGRRGRVERGKTAGRGKKRTGARKSSRVKKSRKGAERIKGAKSPRRSPRGGRARGGG